MVNQVLEYMLRMYVMDKPGKSEDYLHIVEFSYNNNFQVSAHMNPFQILDGHKCNTSISWSSPIDRLMLGPNIIKYTKLTVKEVTKSEGFPK